MCLINNLLFHLFWEFWKFQHLAWCCDFRSFPDFSFSKSRWLKEGPHLFSSKSISGRDSFTFWSKAGCLGAAGFGSKNWKLPWRQRHFLNNFFARKARWMLQINDYSSSASATEVDGCQDQLVAAWRNRGQDGSPNQHLLRNFKNYNFENFWKLAHCFPVGSACVLLRLLPLAQVLGA